MRPWNDPRDEPTFHGIVREVINPGFRTPPLYDEKGLGLSHYAANGRVLWANSSLRLSEVTDGMSNTLAASEVNDHFRAWGQPVN